MKPTPPRRRRPNLYRLNPHQPPVGDKRRIISMKKVSVLIIVSLLASLFVALPALAAPHFLPTQQPQKGFKTPEERAAYEAYWKEQTDWAKKLAMGKEFLSKFTD